MNQSERLAKTLLERVLPGLELRYRVDQAEGAHDFDLYREDCLAGAVEVTASKDATVEETRAAIDDERKGGPFVAARRCKMDWWVHPLPTAKINHLRAKVDDYLADVEAEDIQDFFSWTDATSPAVQKIFRDLGVEAAQVVQWNPPHRIGIALPGGGGHVDSAHVESVVETEAAKPDNRRKLGKVGLDERHLFIYVEPTHYLPWKALMDVSPPASTPRFPAEITRIWVVAARYAVNEFVVWGVKQHQRWDKARIVKLSERALADV